MRLLVKLKTGEEGMIVGYAPGKKGRPMAIVLVERKLLAIRLRNLELLGYAKIREYSKTALDEFDELLASSEKAAPLPN